jgi:ribosomal protein S7
MYKKRFFNNQINLYDKILGFFTKKGSKNKSLNLLNKAFFNVCKVLKKPLNYLVVKLFIILNVFVETKTIRIRRRVHIVPFPVDFKRRIYLVIKWLSFVIHKNNTKISFYEKLVKELFCILKKKNSEVLKLKKANITKALLNRSNIHYRW